MHNNVRERISSMVRITLLDYAPQIDARETDPQILRGT